MTSYTQCDIQWVIPWQAVNERSGWNKKSKHGSITLIYEINTEKKKSKHGSIMLTCERNTEQKKSKHGSTMLTFERNNEQKKSKHGSIMPKYVRIDIMAYINVSHLCLSIKKLKIRLTAQSF